MAGNSALKRIASVIQNPEILGVSNQIMEVRQMEKEKGTNEYNSGSDRSGNEDFLLSQYNR